MLTGMPTVAAGLLAQAFVEANTKKEFNQFKLIILYLSTMMQNRNAPVKLNRNAFKTVNVPPKSRCPPCIVQGSDTISDPVTGLDGLVKREGETAVVPRMTGSQFKAFSFEAQHSSTAAVLQREICEPIGECDGGEDGAPALSGYKQGTAPSNGTVSRFGGTFKTETKIEDCRNEGPNSSQSVSGSWGSLESLSGHQREIRCRVRFALCFCSEDTDRRQNDERCMRHTHIKREKDEVSYYISSNDVFVNRNVSVCARNHEKLRDQTSVGEAAGLKRSARAVRKLKNADIKRENTHTGEYSRLEHHEVAPRLVRGRPKKVDGYNTETSRVQVLSVLRNGFRTVRSPKSGKPKDFNSSVDEQGARPTVRGTQSAISGAPNIFRRYELRRGFRMGSHLGSGTCVKRSVRNSCCPLCGDVKYTPPPSRKKPSGFHSPRSGHTDKQNQTKTGPAAKNRSSSRLVIWLRKYPMVKLCDIARVFNDVPSVDFSCVLPPELSQKKQHGRVHCLKREYRALTRLQPHSDRTHGRRNPSKSQDVSTSTNSCASLPLGGCVVELVEKPEGSTKDTGSYVATRQSRKRLRLSGGGGAPGYSCHPAQVLAQSDHSQGSRWGEFVIGSGKQPAASEGGEVASPLMRRVPPLVLRRLTGNKVSEPVDLSQSLATEDARHGNGFSDRKEEVVLSSEEESDAQKDLEDEICLPHQFSCQRTQAFVSRPRSSCARTYMSWPFPVRGTANSLSSSQHEAKHKVVLAIAAAADVNKLNAKTAETSLKTSTEQTDSKDETGGTCRAPFENGWSEGTQEKVEMAILSREKVELVPAARVPQWQNPLCDVMESHDVPRQSSVRLVEAPTPQGDFETCQSLTEDLIKSNSVPDTTPPEREKQNENPTDKSSGLCLFSQSLENGFPKTEPVDNSYSPKVTPLKEARKCKSRYEYLMRSPSSSSSDEDGGNASAMSSEEQFADDQASGEADEGSSPAVLCKVRDTKESPTQASPLPSTTPECTVLGDDGVLDVAQAYEQDAIILDVIQDDPELFGVVAKESSEKHVARKALSDLTPKVTSPRPENRTPPKNHRRIFWNVKPDSGRGGGLNVVVDIKKEPSEEIAPLVKKEEESQTDSCSKPQSSHGRTWLLPTPQQSQTDHNNNQENGPADRLSSELHPSVQSVPDNKVVTSGQSVVRVDTRENGHVMPSKDASALRPVPGHDKYCWYYFSEHHCCLRMTCWFLHVPRDGDEKFCMDTVHKFCRTGRPGVVQRASDVFVGYYRNNSPGVVFDQQTVNSLLSSLLNFALLGNVVTVINTLLTHKRWPPPEMVLNLFGLVRERRLLNAVPELIHLTSRMAEAGCVFSVDQCEMMQNQLELLQVPRQHMDIFLAVKCRALATNPHTAEISELAQAVVNVELCKQQEDWARLGSVFCSVCVSPRSASELMRFCSCVTMALLKEPKARVTLPYDLFAESVCQQAPCDDQVKSLLGRTGVSLMIRYHRTQQWPKGVKLINVMTRLHIDYSTLKGLFGTENRASRCQLITMAAELVLNSGSVEGALNVLRAHEWFVSSDSWPCEQADVVHRRQLLTQLATRTCHRDTLEVLTKLPGLNEAIEGVEVNDYARLFNTHIQVCMERQVLPVAADTLDFMLMRGLPTDMTLLQNLIHKLGKQSNWSRARTLFKRAQTAGHYKDMECGCGSLILPCQFSEIEMTLAFEMFVTRNLSPPSPSDPPRTLHITLKRAPEDQESLYLAAGSRLLSAALIPNPKLTVRYTTVNQTREQLFHLDLGSALKWLSHNQNWATELWTS